MTTNGRNGSNGGGDGADFDDSDGPTVVIVSRDFLAGSLGRAATALFGAGGVCLDARAMVTSGSNAAAVADLIEELDDLQHIIAGMVRALQRLEFDKEIP